MSLGGDLVCRPIACACTHTLAACGVLARRSRARASIYPHPARRRAGVLERGSIGDVVENVKKDIPLKVGAAPARCQQRAA